MDISNERLSAISTCWEQIREAQADANLPEGRAALWNLLQRYGRTVQRYLLGATRNEEQAQELAQEFAVLFLQGAYRRADSSRGRFRDFLKGILRNLIYESRRKAQRLPRALPENAPEPEVLDEAEAALDATFVRCWRDELMERAWQALSNLESQSGQPYHTVLRYRVDHPDQHSDEMARILSVDLKRQIVPATMRKALQRARDKFADILLADLAESIDNPNRESLEAELMELDLYEYCRPALDRWN